MGVIQWAILYVVASAVVALVAHKKRGTGWRYIGALLLAPVPLMLMVSWSLGNDMDKKPFAMWLAAFMCPAIGFIVALMSDTSEQAAVEKGEFGQYRKCPFCAESVRAEAVKCKHCHSTLAAPPTP
jgi:hypothetical protein